MAKNIKLTNLLEDIEEGSAFDYAARQAKAHHEKSFKLGGKTFPVKEADSSDDKVTEYYDSLIDRIKKISRNLNDEELHDLHERLKAFFNKSI